MAAGCSRPPATGPENAAADQRQQAREEAHKEAQAAQQERDSARQQLDQIPPPAKSRYLAIHTQDNWGNPFLTVGHDSLHLRIVYPEQGGGDAATGTLLRPAKARRQEMDIRIADLPKALAAIPADSWPYGRVIAVEEGSTLIKADRPQIRRNVESTIQVLNDLGIVVDEWTGSGSGNLLQ